MNFTEVNEAGEPLWFLVWKGTKTVTRRAPPCKHCGKKEAEHEKELRLLCPGQRGQTSTRLPTHYEPYLSRWEPMNYATKIGKFNPSRVESQIYKTEYKTIAICPGRGKASICANCGCWKEHHIKGTHLWSMPELKAMEFLSKNGARVCSNYVPLRKRVKSVMLENQHSHWRTKGQ